MNKKVIIRLVEDDKTIKERIATYEEFISIMWDVLCYPTKKALKEIQNNKYNCNEQSSSRDGKSALDFLLGLEDDR